jgi:hypothetical protein
MICLRTFAGVTDPEAPFGRDAAGNPYTREEWEARYVDEANRLRYPGNEGAVDGRRLDFSSAEEFQAHYGDVLHRMGDERGGYLSLPVRRSRSVRFHPAVSTSLTSRCGSPASCPPTQ